SAMGHNRQGSGGAILFCSCPVSGHEKVVAALLSRSKSGLGHFCSQLAFSGSSTCRSKPGRRTITCNTDDTGYYIGRLRGDTNAAKWRRWPTMPLLLSSVPRIASHLFI